MEYIIILGVIFLLFIINSFYQTRKRKKMLIRQIHETWGTRPDNEFDKSDFNSFSQFYKVYEEKRAERVIDDITWNDLELDELYGQINSAWTSMGDAVLYSYLRAPVYDREKLNERVTLIDYWEEHQTEREKVQLVLAEAGKFRPNRFAALLEENEYLELKDQWIYKVLTFLLPAAGLLTFVNVGLGLFMTALIIGINTFYHERAVRTIYSGLEAVTQGHSLVFLARRLLSDQAAGGKEIQARYHVIEKHYNALKSILKTGAMGNLLISFTGDLFQDFGTLIKMVLLLDIWNYQSSIHLLKNHREDLASLIQAVGELDATICIASYRKTLDFWCRPQILWESNEEEPAINAESVRHPLIRNCTSNPILYVKPTLLTGSNASGKSTYIKTVAANVLLAHTLGLCHAAKWTSKPLFPITSMALRDSILNGESYFVAEIRSLKRMFESANDKITCLCVIDEVLRGTNTIERIAASSRLLEALAKLNTCIFAATHDIEITHILSRDFENKHFDETINDDEISFDYKLRDGRAVSRNAIKLLKLMRFEESIVNDAERAVEAFEKTKCWA